MPSRRAVLAGLAASIAPSGGWAAVGNPVAISAARLPDERYALMGLDTAGGITFQVPLPGRGHAAAAHPEQAEVVAIARRPGTFAKVIDCATGTIRQTLNAPDGRHFYGHGTFSADGTLLFTTENETATGQGRIGVWDRGQSYTRIEELPSHGIGPHEILRRPDGTLAIANGGIRTHPDTGREKLNLDTMRPNLTILSASGRLLDQAEPPDGQNSLRHIAAQADGTIACGFQWQGDPFESPPLIALYRGNGVLHDAQMDEVLLRGLDGYIGSVSANGQTGFAATSPRGNRLISVTAAGAVTHVHNATDICGLAQTRTGQTLATDGTGAVYESRQEGWHVLRRHAVAFDNHLVAVQQ
ncbi:MAG: DUF1513 domain-containing protein [Pseudomonadota bacterium]